MAELRVGTSGYAYKQWKGSFYPEKLPDAQMLRFYGEQFRTVEINHSFYQMPREAVLAKWGEQVGAGFQFALKLNQKITHIMKLRGAESTLKRFLEAASVLQGSQGENKLGPVLVQLPPTFKADLALLDEFLALRPRAFRFAFEVRHPSWHTEEVYALLRKHETALCLAETDKEPAPDVLTASFTYLRLRREEYTTKQLADWRARIAAWLAQGTDVFAYLKHEEEGQAPAYARKLLAS
jgi:uncharacterized protein YecE (DUF72 family)